MAVATPAFAGGHAQWKSVDDQSSIAFGSVKKNTVGEVHTFEGVTGTVGENGELTINIDVSSVETNIDIRNERMAKHVFKDNGITATITGTIDMDEVKSMAVGDVNMVDVEAKLALGGASADIEAEMLVARLADNRVLVTTANMLFVSTADLGIDEGVDMLMKLAKLPGITRAVPVTIRMVFQK